MKLMILRNDVCINPSKVVAIQKSDDDTITVFLEGGHSFSLESTNDVPLTCDSWLQGICSQIELIACG